MDDLFDRIYNKTKEIESSLNLDWRYSYISAERTAEGGGAIEMSSEELFESLPGRLKELPIERSGKGMLTAGTGPGAVSVRLVRPPEARRLWVISSVADVRREPSHASELVSQLIMGEDAGALKSEGDWYFALLTDRYHGWIRSWSLCEVDLAEVTAYRERVSALVSANITYVREAPDPVSMPLSDLVAGTELVAGAAHGGYREVFLPGGKRGYAAGEDLEETAAAPEKDLRGRIVQRAMRFIGIPYLWGGTSSKGFDCSGLVKRVFMMEGIALPRDSDRQALVGVEIEIEEAAPGDLLFFGEGEAITHVAIYLGERRFVHAYGEVRINSLSQDDPLYDPKLSGILRSARRVLD